MKKCNVCDRTKNFDSFALDAKSSDGRTNICKQCKQQKDRVRIRKYDYAAMRRSKLVREYGLTPQQADELFKNAENKCEVCGSQVALQIDHCHTTRVVRGILCHQCNSAIGMLDDSVDRMKKLIAYMERAPKEINLFAHLNSMAGNQRK